MRQTALMLDPTSHRSLAKNASRLLLVICCALLVAACSADAEPQASESPQASELETVVTDTPVADVTVEPEVEPVALGQLILVDDAAGRLGCEGAVQQTLSIQPPSDGPLLATDHVVVGGIEAYFFTATHVLWTEWCDGGSVGTFLADFDDVSVGNITSIDIPGVQSVHGTVSILAEGFTEEGKARLVVYRAGSEPEHYVYDAATGLVGSTNPPVNFCTPGFELLFAGDSEEGFDVITAVSANVIHISVCADSAGAIEIYRRDLVTSEGTRFGDACADPNRLVWRSTEFGEIEVVDKSNDPAGPPGRVYFEIEDVSLVWNLWENVVRDRGAQANPNLRICS